MAETTVATINYVKRIDIKKSLYMMNTEKMEAWSCLQ